MSSGIYLIDVEVFNMGSNELFKCNRKVLYDSKHKFGIDVSNFSYQNPNKARIVVAGNLETDLDYDSIVDGTAKKISSLQEGGVLPQILDYQIHELDYDTDSTLIISADRVRRSYEQTQSSLDDFTKEFLMW